MDTRWLWVAEQQMRSESAVADLISTCERCHITRLVPILHRWDGALLNSSVLVKSELRLGRLMPITYLAERAHEAGMEVMGWWILGSTEEWVQSWEYVYPLGFPSEWDTEWLADCDTSCLNFSLAEVREVIREIAADLQLMNPELDGLSIDYIRYEGGMVQNVASLDKADLDQTVEAIAEVCDWELIMSGVPPYVGGDYVGGWDTLGTGQDWPGWIEQGLISAVKVMNYMRPAWLDAFLSRHYDNNDLLTDEIRARVVNGISLDYDNLFSAAELREAVEITRAHGYPFAIFDSRLLSQDEGFEEVLADYPLGDGDGNGNGENGNGNWLYTAVAGLRESAHRLEAIADVLEGAYVSAQAAVVEAEEALAAAREVEEKL